MGVGGFEPPKADVDRPLLCRSGTPPGARGLRAIVASAPREVPPHRRATSPYVFATVDELKRRLRQEGRDVVDLGFGNPDIPSHALVVDKLVEAAAKPANHRYSPRHPAPARRCRPALRAPVRRVSVDPEQQAVATIGAKEGLAH